MTELRTNKSITKNNKIIKKHKIITKLYDKGEQSIKGKEVEEIKYGLEVVVFGIKVEDIVIGDRVDPSVVLMNAVVLFHISVDDLNSVILELYSVNGPVYGCKVFSVIPVDDLDSVDSEL